MSYPHVFQPLKMGAITLSNRIAMAPMTRGRAGPKHKANELMAEYYAQRASAGLIITEGTHTSMYGRGWFEAPDIFTDEDAEAWKIVTDKVHAAGGKIFCQLWHTGRASHSNLREGLPGFEGDLALAVAPSALKRASRSGKQTYTNAEGEVDIETPRALTEEEVDALPAEFKNCAEKAKAAGFDGVEIHGANGYLLDEFLQSCSNERTDKYGGSIENRFRIMEDVLKAVLEVFEPSQVGLRLSPNGVYNGMGSEDFREQFLYAAEQLAKYNLGYLHVMVGLDFGFHKKGEPMTLKEFRKVYPGVIMGAVGMDAEKAERLISDGDCDMVSIGRPYISNPDLVERYQQGATLADPDPKTFFTGVGSEFGAEGYTTYPKMDAEVKAE